MFNGPSSDTVIYTTPPTDEHLTQLERDAEATAGRVERARNELHDARRMHQAAVGRLADARRARHYADRNPA